MRAAYVIAIAIIAASASLSAQDKPKKEAPPPKTKTLTLSGCIAEDATKKNLTIEDVKSGSYRLTGMSLRDYIGQRVELAGSVYESKKLVIKGGLLPSPNTAAQAGAIDQTQVANETHGGSGPTGDPQLPEFRVRASARSAPAVSNRLFGGNRRTAAVVATKVNNRKRLGPADDLGRRSTATRADDS